MLQQKRASRKMGAGDEHGDSNLDHSNQIRNGLKVKTLYSQNINGLLATSG